jgi:glycosyltransferase involved in cell wall biosynthesis
MPHVVVGIPTFNRAQGLARAVESALAQDYPNLTVLISDNASTDGTAQVCSAFAARDRRVVFWRQTSNVGGTRNFISVLERAAGTYFLWLADDDWLDSSYVRRCVAFLSEHADYVVAGGCAQYHQDGAFVRKGAPTICDAGSAKLRVLQYYRQVDDNGIFYGVMRLAAARRIDLLNCLGSDWLFLAAMAYQGKVRSLDDVFVHRALGGASESLSKMTRALGLPAWQARIPLSFSLAAYAARDIGWNNPVYSDMPRARRRAFALLVSCWMCSIKPVQELLRRIRARASLRRALA